MARRQHAVEGAAHTAARRTGSRPAPRTRSKFREYAEAIIVAVALALFVRQFVVQAFRIPSESMMNTLLVGDFLFVNKFIYGAQIPWTDMRLPAVREPHRGDIIVFKSPTDGRDFIKRCVAVGGDTLELRGMDLFLNGVHVDEPYAYYSGGRSLQPFGPYVVPPGKLFMMGDNRNNSQDSRFWGPLDANRVKGKAMFIYWSMQSWFPPRVRFSRIGDVIR